MTACEKCWTEASRQAAMLGGSVVDRYRALIANPDNYHPRHDAPCKHSEWEINPPEPDRGITQRWASCVECGQWTADLEVDWEVEVDEDGFPVVTGSVLIPRWPEEPT